jgi:hypothetical protein
MPDSRALLEQGGYPAFTRKQPADVKIHVSPEPLAKKKSAQHVIDQREKSLVSKHEISRG